MHPAGVAKRHAPCDDRVMRRATPGGLVLAALAGGCGPSVTVEPVPVREPIEVAANLPLSGELAAYGGVWRQVIELAARQLEAAGGPRLELRFYDNASDPDRAEDHCAAIAATGAAAMIGPGTSASVERCLPTIAAGLVTLTGASTAPHLAGDGDAGNLFRTVASDAQQAEVLAYDAAGQAITSLAIVHVEGGFYEALRDRLVDALAARDVAVSAVAILESDAASTWASIGGVPAVAFLGGGPELLTFAEAAPADVALFAAGHVADPTLGAALYAAAPGARLVANTHARGGSFASFAQAFPHPPHTSFGPQFYDATLLLGLALHAADGRGEGPREVLLEVARPPGAALGPAALEAALEAAPHHALDYDGAGGPCDFDAAGEVESPFAILRPDPSGLIEVAVVEPGDL